MADCPFCKATVDDALVRDGGRCPRCFIEIPGEETPTHPGVEPLTHPSQDAPPSARRRLGTVVIPAAVLLLVAGAVLWKIRADRAEDSRAVAEVVPLVDDPPDVPAGAGTGSHRSSRSRSGENGGDEVVPSDGPRTPTRFDFTDEEADATFSGLAQPAGPRELNLGLPQDPDGPVRLRRVGASSYALTDPDEIRAAVGTAIRNYRGQVSLCYDQRLKTDPGLKGTWTLALTILPDGSTADVRFAPQGTSDAEIESCVTHRASTWSFQPMVQAQRFELPFTFGSGN